MLLLDYGAWTKLTAPRRLIATATLPVTLHFKHHQKKFLQIKY